MPALGAQWGSEVGEESYKYYSLIAVSTSFFMKALFEFTCFEIDAVIGGGVRLQRNVFAQSVDKDRGHFPALGFDASFFFDDGGEDERFLFAIEW